MAQFRGTLQSGSGKVSSRLGNKTGGLTVTCNGWDIGLECVARHVDGEDLIMVYSTGGSNGGAYKGVVGVLRGDGTFEREVS